MQHDDLLGTAIYDATGDHVGKVEQTYPDDGSTVRFARVKIGTLLAKHRLVPLEDATPTRDGLQVPYSRQAIESAPDLPKEVDPLSGMAAEDLQGYYASSRDTGTGTGEPASNPVQPETSELSRSGAETNDAVLEDGEIPAVSRVPEPDVGQVRDRGDFVEIPVVEERLVKQPVVTEVVRVHKTHTTDERTASADVRKEDIETDPDVPVREPERES